MGKSGNRLSGAIKFTKFVSTYPRIPFQIFEINPVYKDIGYIRCLNHDFGMPLD